MTGPTCHLCDVELFDDPHWHDDLEVLVCNDCCPSPGCTMFSVGGETGDSRPSARMPDGDHTTTQGLSLPGGAALAADGPTARVLTLDELEDQALRRDRLVLLAIACAVALALVGLVRFGPGDASIAGASSGDGCGGWRDEVAELFPGEVDFACGVIACESGYNPNAVSRTNDHGLAQVNAPTWARPGHPDPVAHFIGVHWDRRYDGWSNLVFAQKIRHHYGWRMWACA